MICRIVQYYLSLVDGDKPRAFASSHLQGCDVCQRFQSDLTSLDQRLRSTSAMAPSPGLHVAGAGARLPAFAALACAIAVVILVLNSPTNQPAAPTPNQPQVPRVTQAHSLPPAPQPDSPMPPRQSWNLPQLQVLASRAPMQEELDALRQDGKRGMDAIMRIGRRK